MILNIKYTHIVFVLLGALAATSVKSQHAISLNEAFEMAKANNLKLRSDAMLINYQKALVNTAYNLDPTQFHTELGQFNSAYFDTGLSISQSFSLPSVYRKQKEVRLLDVKSSEYYFKMSEVEIRQQLDEIYLEDGYLKAKIKLLDTQDSLFAAFLQRALIRVQKGETTILEKITAEQQKIKISNLKSVLVKMLEVNTLKFGLLINADTSFIPYGNTYEIIPYNVFFDEITILKHPALQLANHEIEAAKMKVSIEKTNLLPRFNVGYSNISIKGLGADNNEYNGKDRFSSVQVGVSLPVFRKNFRSSIDAAQVMADTKSIAYETKRSEIISQIKQKYIIYKELLEQLDFYKKNAIPNAQIIRSVSENQMATGQINYLEYVILSDQATAIENDYIEMLKNLNTIIIDLHYLTTYY